MNRLRLLLLAFPLLMQLSIGQAQLNPFATEDTAAVVETPEELQRRYFSNISYHVGSKFEEPLLLMVAPGEILQSPEGPHPEDWQTFFQSMAAPSAEIHIEKRRGFHLVCYGAEPAALIEQSLAGGRVPALVLLAPDAKQAIAIWSAASGLKIDTDKDAEWREEKQMSKLREENRERFAEQEKLGTRDHWEKEFTIRHHLKFPEGAPLPEFMQGLAGLVGCVATPKKDGGWSIALSDGEQLAARIEILLMHFSDERYTPAWHDAKDELIQIGEAAVPQVLAAARKAAREGERHSRYDAMIGILAKIPSEERDAFFQQELELALKGERSSQYFWYGTEMVEALGESKYEPALPLLTKMAAEETNERVRVAAIRAAARMGVLPTARPLDQLVEMDAEAVKAAGAPEVAEAFAALLSVVDENFAPYGMPIILRNVKRDAQGIKFTGDLRDGKGTWEVRLWFDETPDSFIVYAAYYCGSLCAAGYEGRVEKKGDRWVVTKWRQEWVS